MMPLVSIGDTNGLLFISLYTTYITLTGYSSKKRYELWLQKSSYLIFIKYAILRPYIFWS